MTPTMGTVGAELYDALWPLAGDDEANGFALAHIAEAVGRMWQFVADLSEDRDERPGWAQLVDVETAPADALEFVSQIPGVRLTVGASEDFRRNEVRTKAGKDRGRPRSTVAKIKPTLTGTQTVRYVERTGSAWHHTIITRTSETPDAAATYAAMLSDKPEGDIFEHIVSDEPIIAEFTRDISAITADPLSSFTLADVT